MSRLPQIPTFRTINKPAQDAKTFPDLRMSRLVINSPQTIKETPASMTLEPYNFETKEFGDPSESIRVEYDDLEAAAARYAAAGRPELAQAIGAVVAAVIAIVSDPDIAASEQNGVIEIKEPE